MRVLDRGEGALVLEPSEHRFDGLVVVPLEVFGRLGVHPEDVEQLQLWRLALPVLPELKHLLHLLAVKLHPLASELDQWRPGFDELLPFALVDHLAADRELVLIRDQRVHAHVVGADDGGGLPAGWPWS